MNPQIRTLEQLGYIIECLALDYTGEAKSELSGLVGLLATDERFAFPGGAEVAGKLGEARACLISSDTRSCAGILSQVSRDLWKQAMDS